VTHQQANGDRQPGRVKDVDLKFWRWFAILDHWACHARDGAKN